MAVNIESSRRILLESLNVTHSVRMSEETKAGTVNSSPSTDLAASSSLTSCCPKLLN